MDNNLITPKMITFNMLDEFLNEIVILPGFTTKWEKDFAKKGMKIGDTELIRKPQRWIPKFGMNYQPQPINDTYSTLTIDRNVQIGFDWGAFDEVLSIDDQYNRYFRTSINQEANQWDEWAAQFAYLNTGNISGTLGTNPASLNDSQLLFLTALAILQENGCPIKELTAALSPALAAAVMSYLNTNFNPQDALSRQYRDGKISAAFGFSGISMEQNLYSDTMGTFVGTPAVNGASVNGDTQIVTDGWTAGDYVDPGNVFKVGSVNNVNPKTRRSTGRTQFFVVGGNARLTADSGGNMTIPLGGGFVLYDASQQYADVDALPADNALLTFYPGTSSPSTKSGTQGVAFGKQAYGFACIELPKMAGCNIAEIATDPKTGISLAVHQGSDIKSYERISRIDSAGGFVALYPANEAVRLIGA